MPYEQFMDNIRERLQAKIGPQHRLEFSIVTKNNGVHLTGISDHTEGSTVAPTVYIDSYYDLFNEGSLSLDDICEDLLLILSEHPMPGSIKSEDLTDFEKMRPLIMLRLIHASSNRELLKEIPFIPYLDLAIIFYLSLEKSKDGQLTALIRLEQMNKWKLTEKDLLKLAMENSESAYPAQIHSMSQVLYGFSYKSEDLPLFVLTNDSGIYGASCMLYRNVLKKFAGLLESSLIIIPSSVHEVLLAPVESGFDLRALNSMVSEINQNEVDLEDRLSDHIYIYDRITDEISIPFSQNPATSL